MRKSIEKNQFVVFSLLTLLISIVCWSIAKEQTGTLKFIFTQLGYLGPAIVAVILSVGQANKNKKIPLKSYIPLIIIVILTFWNITPIF